MVIRGMPSLAVTIEPLFDTDQNATSLAVSVRCDDHAVQANQPLFTLQKLITNVPMPDYGEDTNPITVSHNKGKLPLWIDEDADRKLEWRRWLVSRASSGPIVWSFKAPPRPIDAKTPTGSRHDLRMEQGGLTGSPSHFFPQPVPADSKEQWKFSLKWNLDKAPVGTRAVWTFGDGSRVRSRVDSIEKLIQTYLA